MGQIGSIRFWFNLDSVRIISDFGSTRIVTVLIRFNFEFRVEIGSTFLHVGSGSISDHSVRVIRTGILLPGLGLSAWDSKKLSRT